MSKPITISIVGNAGPLKKSLTEADKALADFGQGLKKFGLAAAAGVGTLAAGIGFAAKAAAEDQKSFALMENAIRNVTGATHEQIKAVDEQIAAMSMATGVADDKLRPAYAALVRGTRDVEIANRDLSLVLDISTALQMDATQVADALAKGYEGNTKALKSLSPEMAAVIKEGASMSEIMDILSANFSGAAAAAADTFEGRMARLQVAFSEIVEQIGYAVLPILEKIATFIADRIVPVVQDFADAFSERGLGGVLDLTIDKFFTFYDEASNLTKAIVLATTATMGLYGAMKTLEFIDNVTTLAKGLKLAIDNATVSMGIFQTTALGMAKIVGLAFASVAISIDQLFADNGFAAKGLLRSVAQFANGIITTIETAAEAVNYIINSAIRAYNLLNPFQDLPLLPTTITLPRVNEPSPYGTQSPKTLPTFVVPSIEPRGGGATLPAPVIPETVVPTTPTVTGGGGGGGKGGTVTILPVDMTGQIPLFPSTEISGGGGGGFGAIIGNEAVLDGLTGGMDVSITVNTVSADANLPNLIVEALQQYNLTSGPIDVAIAV
jgi:hypothetical protein